MPRASIARWIGVLLVGAVCSAPGSAAADPAAAGSHDAPSEPTAATSETTPAPFTIERAGAPGLRRFAPVDYAATAAALGLYFAVELSLDTVDSSDLGGPAPWIDEPARELFVLGSRRARERADLLSDYFWYGTTSYPVVAAVLVPLARRQSADMIWQLEMMNLQAYSVASLLIRIPHKTVGRARPSVEDCRLDPQYSRHCGQPGQFVSFYGGHTAVTTTGAGLACAHHIHARLLGNPLADGLACGLALAAAGAVLVTRMQADRHWLTDQLLGSAVGLGVGYGLPTFFYYKPFWRDRDNAGRQLRGEADNAIVVPYGSSDGIGATMMGRF